MLEIHSSGIFEKRLEESNRQWGNVGIRHSQQRTGGIHRPGGLRSGKKPGVAGMW